MWPSFGIGFAVISKLFYIVVVMVFCDNRNADAIVLVSFDNFWSFLGRD
jgi:hypothetical protein